MAKLLGEELQAYLTTQIQNRQLIHGSGVNGERTPEQIISEIEELGKKNFISKF